MFEKIDTMRMARSLMRHAADRQSVVARNVANADTPGYRAADLTGFAQTWRNGAAGDLRATRPDHLPRIGWQDGGRLIADDAPASPNGNTVTLEEEMLKAAEVKREHELSLGIYRSAIDLMRKAIGRRG